MSQIKTNVCRKTSLIRSTQTRSQP